MTTTYEGSTQQYGSIAERNVIMHTRDGVALAADVYYPALGGQRADGEFPTVLERTPYGKSAPRQANKGHYFARRGYVCVIQDVRGRFDSEGEFYAFAKEAPDGFDCVEWIAAQPWANGKVGTIGDSYAGSDQAALATLDPPHLSAMVVAVGASNYYHSSMRQNGALEQRFLIYAFRMATTSREAAADPALKAALIREYTQRLPDHVRRFPLKEGATILRRLPSYERWAIDILTNGDYTDYWRQRGYAPDEYYDEHADVPTLYLGGWYDSYARNTCASYVALSKTKQSPQHLLMGPWTHGQYEVTHSGELDFGPDAQIHYNDLRLSFFDHHLKGLRSEAVDWSPVRIFTMGTGDGARAILGAPGSNEEYAGLISHGGYWREEQDWPVPGTTFTPYYLHSDGGLSTEPPEEEKVRPSEYSYDPKNPVPTIGGGISAAETIMRAGGFDQRGRPDFFGCDDTLPLNTRPDVLTFQTEPLSEPVEVTGPIEVRLWASSTALDTDFTAKLIDVYPPSADHPDGLAINLTDSIIRGRYHSGWEKARPMHFNVPYELVFQLYPTSNVFKAGHRIRVDVSSSNWPRFDANPNTGGPLGLRQSSHVAQQKVYHDRDRPSCVVLPVGAGRVSV